VYIYTSTSSTTITVIYVLQHLCENLKKLEDGPWLDRQCRGHSPMPLLPESSATHEK
jgi:hypothetical protein